VSAATCILRLLKVRLAPYEGPALQMLEVRYRRMMQSRKNPTKAGVDASWKRPKF